MFSLFTFNLSICFGEPVPTFPNHLLLELQAPRLCGSQPPLPPALGCFSGIFTSSCVSPWLLKAIHSLSKVTSFYDTISRAFSDFLVPESRFTNSATHCFRSSRLFSHLFPSRISAKLLYNSASNSDSFFSGICRPSPLVTTFPCALHMSFWSLHRPYNFLCLLWLWFSMTPRCRSRSHI